MCVSMCVCLCVCIHVSVHVLLVLTVTNDNYDNAITYKQCRTLTAHTYGDSDTWWSMHQMEWVGSHKHPSVLELTRSVDSWLYLICSSPTQHPVCSNMADCSVWGPTYAVCIYCKKLLWKGCVQLRQCICLLEVDLTHHTPYYGKMTTSFWMVHLTACKHSKMCSLVAVLVAYSDCHCSTSYHKHCHTYY